MDSFAGSRSGSGGDRIDFAKMLASYDKLQVQCDLRWAVGDIGSAQVERSRERWFDRKLFRGPDAAYFLLIYDPDAKPVAARVEAGER